MYNEPKKIDSYDLWDISLKHMHYHADLLFETVPIWV